MSEFFTDLHAEDVSEGSETNAYQLTDQFLVWSDVLGDALCVPAGFKCDGESIPAFLRWLVPPFGQTKRGAFLHDWLYRNAGYWVVTRDQVLLVPNWETLPQKLKDRAEYGGKFINVDRKKADAVYREFALLKGAPAWRVAIRHTVLRLTGFAAWNANRKADKR